MFGAEFFSKLQSSKTLEMSQNVSSFWWQFLMNADKPDIKVFVSTQLVIEKASVSSLPLGNRIKRCDLSVELRECAASAAENKSVLQVCTKRFFHLNVKWEFSRRSQSGINDLRSAAVGGMQGWSVVRAAFYADYNSRLWKCLMCCKATGQTLLCCVASCRQTKRRVMCEREESRSPEPFFRTNRQGCILTPLYFHPL